MLFLLYFLSHHKSIISNICLFISREWCVSMMLTRKYFIYWFLSSPQWIHLIPTYCSITGHVIWKTNTAVSFSFLSLFTLIALIILSRMFLIFNVICLISHELLAMVIHTFIYLFLIKWSLWFNLTKWNPCWLLSVKPLLHLLLIFLLYKQKLFKPELITMQF